MRGLPSSPQVGLINYGAIANGEDETRWYQLHDNRDAQCSAEKMLVWAILEDGIEQATRGKDERARFEARWWINDDGHEYIFSFANCCEILGLNPAWARKHLQSFIKRRPI